jgi:hypothetical protein
MTIPKLGSQLLSGCFDCSGKQPRNYLNIFLEQSKQFETTQMALTALESNLETTWDALTAT